MVEGSLEAKSGMETFSQKWKNFENFHFWGPLPNFHIWALANVNFACIIHQFLYKIIWQKIWTVVQTPLLSNWKLKRQVMYDTLNYLDLPKKTIECTTLWVWLSMTSMATFPFVSNILAHKSIWRHQMSPFQHGNVTLHNLSKLS